MSFLLIYSAEDSRPDWDRVLAAIRRLPEAREVSGSRHVWEFDYEWAGDSTAVWPSAGGDVVHIDGAGPASLQLALAMQRACHTPLHVVDDVASVDVALQGLATVDDLMLRLESERTDDNRVR